jgi:hypothetical protein
MSDDLRQAKRVLGRTGRARGWLAVAAVLAGLAVGCAPVASAPPAAPATGSADETMHPLARRQAAAQAQQAPVLEQAQEAAAAAVAAREAADAVALEQAKAEAVGMLGEAVSLRQAGQLGAAVDRARQALARWPDYADAKSFLSETEPQAAAQATAQARQEEAEARARAAAAAQATAQARRNPRPPAPAPAGRQPTPGPSPLPTTEDVLARAHGLIAGLENEPLRELATTLVQRQVKVEFGPLPPGALGLWQPQQNTITVNEQYRASSVEGIAGILVHEATHAYDHYRGRQGTTTGECYDLEGRAFANQAKYWEARHGRGGKPGATDPLEKQLNTIMLVVNEKPLTFAVELMALYQGECAG